MHTMTASSAVEPAVGGSKGLTTASWVVTGLFAAMMTLSGVAYVVGFRALAASMRELGYPDYFPGLLGVAKLLGVAGILLPGMPRLREWAYAGFTFELVAAIASHLITGTAAHVPPAVFALALMSTSYILRR